MKGYFQHITFKYNLEICRTLKDYCNEVKRLVQQQQRLKFLLSCRSYGIIPNHTSNTTTKVTQLFECRTLKGQLNNIEYNFHKKILNLEVSQTNINIKLIKRKLYNLSTGIKDMLTNDDYTTFINKQTDRAKHMTTNIRERQISKLNTLKEKHFKLHGLIFNDHWFENKTKIEIPIECKWMLSLGKKFAIPVNRNNFSSLHVIADVEQCIQAIEDNVDKEKDVLRTKLANKVTEFNRKIKNTPREKLILTIFEKTRKFIKRHNDIIIIQADKGNKTVAIYKNEYKSKMEKLLEDKNTYRTSRADPTLKLQRTNNNIVTDLHKSGYIDLWQKRRLHCSAANAPRIYGLPKIHKTGIPLRPIVSSTQVPCYQLSKYVGQILKNLISEKYNVKNSTQLKEQLVDIKLDKDNILISFDVVSLFTNIPVHTAIKNIMGKWNTIKNFTKIPSSKFLEILKFCLTDNNYFMYENKIINQIFGMPMGNPLSPTIADILLDCLLDEAITELKNRNIDIKYIAKYVDDILAVINIKDKDEILQVLNKYHHKIQFTMEIEENNEIAYLDTKLHREGDKIIFDWYAKETSTGRIMNFYATQPKNQIINTAKNFIYRVLNISDERFYHKNIPKIQQILTDNSFPKNLIKTLIENVRNQIRNKIQKTKHASDEDKHFYSVRYIPGLTDNRNIKTTIQSKNICYAYKPNQTLSTIFTNVKTPIDKQQQCNIVYEIQCNGGNDQNCDLIYIGTTKRTLETRVGEHMVDINKRKDSTALSQHINQTGHTADFENVKILDKETMEKKRMTIESLRIQQQIRRTMNHKEDTDNINTSYRVAII